MARMQQLGLPGILISLLLLLNLLPTALDQKGVTPTPAPSEEQPITVTYPDLPGRLIFRSGNSLLLLEHQEVKSVPLSASFDLTEDPRAAFSPNGRWVAGFNRMDDQFFLVTVDLSTGWVTSLITTVPGQIRWSPSSDQIAYWAGARLMLVGLDGAEPTTLILGEGETIQSVAWSPDGTQLAVVRGQMEASDHSIVLVDVATGTYQTVAQRSTHPFWAPNRADGLVFARQPQANSQASEILLRKPDGQEVVLATVDDLLKANPEVATIQGAIPHVTSIQGDHNPASILFTLKYYSNVNPRFGIGTLALPGTPALLYLLPIYPDHPLNQSQSPKRPCSPGELYPTESGIYFMAHSIGCEGLLGRLDRATWTPSADPWPQVGTGLVAPDGNYILTQVAPGVMPTATPIPSGSSKLVPLYGEPIHWDRG